MKKKIKNGNTKGDRYELGRFVITIMMICWAFCSLLFIVPAVGTLITFFYYYGSFRGFSWGLVTIDWEQSLVVSGIVSALFLATTLLTVWEEKEKKKKKTRAD